MLRNSSEYEEWEEAALHLDALLGLDLWRNNAPSKHYDYHLINERLASIEVAHDVGDVHALVNLLRSGLVRNLGNITATKLYNRSFAGTKFLIEEYITQVAEAIEDIASLPTAAAPAVNVPNTVGGGVSGPTSAPIQQPVVIFEAEPIESNGNGRERNGSGLGSEVGRLGGFDASLRSNAITSMSIQMKLDFVHDTRQAFGRSTLVLQGGAIFGLCHLGVVKALFLRGLLPRIITGTATGALIAALVAIHTEEELPRVLSGDGIDLSAFSGRGRKLSTGENIPNDSIWSRWATLMRRVQRFRRDGYFLDVKVLEDCVRTNVGDLTFEEAYQRSKRVLNITVATAGQGGVPTLLNYLTAPNVVSPFSLLKTAKLPPPPNYKNQSNQKTNPPKASLDSSSSLQRLDPLPLRPPRDPRPLQGLPRQHHPLEARQHGRLPPLDARLVLGPRGAPPAHRRALQRQPLHRQPGPPLPHPLSAKRHARPLARRDPQQDHLHDGVSGPHDGP